MRTFIWPSASVSAAAFFYFYCMARDLHWFKFSPLDWMTGRIRKETPRVQVAFLELVCQYWKNDCVMTIEQAKLEVPAPDLERLIARRLVKIQCDCIKIQFLDEQMTSIDGISEKRREAIKARWDKKKGVPDTSVIQNDTNVLQLNKVVIQNDTEKRREEKTREEKIILPFGSLFATAWERWLKFRKEIKQPYKSTLSKQAALKKLSRYTEEEAVAMIEQSITNQWRGIFESKETKQATNQGARIPSNPYEIPEHNKSLWSLEAWEEQYGWRLDTDENFRKHFGYDELHRRKAVGSNGKS